VFRRFYLSAALASAMVGIDAGAAFSDLPALKPAGALAGWVRAATGGRADVVCIGDSNQAFAGHGWDHGLTRAAASQFGLFASGLFSAGENNGSGLGLGYECSILSTACCVPAFQYSGAPGPLHMLMPGDAFMYPLNYVYLPAGSVGGGSANNGLYLDAANPIGLNDALRYEVTYGLFPGAGGSFQLAIRLGQAPYTPLVSGPVTQTSGGDAYGWSTASIDLSPGARNAALNPRFTPWGTDLHGPAILYTQRLLSLSRQRGASVSTLYARGGQSARDMALGLLTVPDEHLRMCFSRIREGEAASKAVLVRVSTGLNDRNEDQPSLGPGAYADGASPEAFADNLRAIVQRLTALWQNAGWDTGELYFLFAVSHPVSNPDDALLVAYRVAAAALAGELPRCSVLRLDVITTSDEMAAMGWYQAGGTDHFHLTQSAYEVLSEREFSALVTLSCLPDLNDDRAINTADLTIMLAHFGSAVAPVTGGDLNGDGRVDLNDLVLLLARFGTSCPSP